ncbi:MAG: hypothetical protein QGF53_12325 [Alphaproteobacteria bacterium]|nr:hypothetical protein [Alphaproteobacteria bacterium]
MFALPILHFETAAPGAQAEPAEGENLQPRASRQALALILATAQEYGCNPRELIVVSQPIRHHHRGYVQWHPVMVLMARQARRCLERPKSPKATHPLAVGNAQRLAIGQNGSQHIGTRLANDFATRVTQKPPHPVIPGNNPLFAVNSEGGI